MAFKFKFLFIGVGLSIQVAFGQAPDIVIVGAKIETGDGTVIPSGTIVIRDGKIASIAPFADSDRVPGAIDGAGWVIYPGFIDAYSTRGLKLPDAPEPGTAPSPRETAPPSMWHGNRKGIRADILAYKCLDLADRSKEARAMGITTELLSPGQGSIRGLATIVDFNVDGMVVKPVAAGEFALRGGGFGGGGGGGYPGTLFGVTALTRQVLADAQSYGNDPNGKKDPELENLQPVVNGQVPAFFVADTAREINRAVRIAGEFGLKTVIEGGREAYRELPALKSQNVPVILSLDLAAAPSRTPETGPDAVPQAVLDDRYSIWEEHSQNAKLLYQAGVPIAFALGGGFGEYLTGVRKLISLGLPRDAALKAMTSDAAAILGISDKVGTIQTGKLANLTIMSGDFADEKNGKVISVFVEGKRFDVGKGGSK